MKSLLLQVAEGLLNHQCVDPETAGLREGAARSGIIRREGAGAAEGEHPAVPHRHIADPVHHRRQRLVGPGLREVVPDKLIDPCEVGRHHPFDPDPLLRQGGFQRGVLPQGIELCDQIRIVADLSGVHLQIALGITALRV